jgi:PDDEXK-like domain of unknown function (DUF3799)/LAGLIDADG-like domain
LSNDARVKPVSQGDIQVVTAPGVYSMAEAEYHGDPVPEGSLSCSGAKLLLPPNCPAVFNWARKNGRTPTRALEFGTAAHKEVLGTGWPVAVFDGKDWTTKAAKEFAQAARAAGQVPILGHEREQITAMAAAIRAHPTAPLLLNAEEILNEQSFFWVDDETGIWLRARMDAVRLRNRFLVVDYKGLALDTPLPTPDGWTTMRAVQVGDRLLDSAGRPCTVTGKSDVHWRSCYRVRFDDASSVICDADHLWATVAGRPAGKGGHLGYRPAKARTTEEIRSTLRLYGQCHHRVPVAGALELPPIGLPIHPYVLGCWLGDGSRAGGRITNPDEELFTLIAACGYHVGRDGSAAVAAGGKCPTRTAHGLTRQLRLAGLLGHKAIPAAYLRAGHGQRLALLQGLMDTDGSWNETRGQVVYSTTCKQLGLAVRELALTLGQRAVLHEVTQHGFGLTVTAYWVTFTPRGIRPFRLSRKAGQVTPRSGVRASRRVIMAVEDVPTVATQCLTVDSPDSTYLCTDAMIPTHNSARSADPDEFAKAAGRYLYHMQDAHYREAVTHVLGDADPLFLFVVQEKAPPYEVAVYELDGESLWAGAERNQRARRIYARCVAAGEWPGYQPGEEKITTISVPRWAR